VLLGIVLLTPLAAPETADVLAVEVVDTVERALKPRPDPREEPERPLPRDPAPERPRLIPASARQRLVDEARAYRSETEPESDPNPYAEPGLEASEPAPLFEIPMEATVGGGEGIEVVAVAGKGEVLARPGAPGVRGGKGKGKPTRPSNAQTAESWEITAQPRPLNDHRLQPAYPPDARARGLEGVVIVELVIDRRGRVVQTRVVRSSGAEFDRAARAHCRRLRFEPAEANGKPVSARIEWRVEFKLRNR
jgi:protein TonB